MSRYLCKGGVCAAVAVADFLVHSSGGAAGVVSRITGSVGKGLAAITMDKEYQQKRREEMGRQPKDFGDSLARGGKGFLRVSLLLSLEESISDARKR